MSKENKKNKKTKGLPKKKKKKKKGLPKKNKDKRPMVVCIKRGRSSIQKNADIGVKNAALDVS